MMDSLKMHDACTIDKQYSIVCVQLQSRALKDHVTIVPNSLLVTLLTQSPLDTALSMRASIHTVCGGPLQPAGCGRPSTSARTRLHRVLRG